MSSEKNSVNKSIVNFFYEETDFRLSNKISVIRWLLDAYIEERKEVNSLNYIFCSDSYLHQINLQYLNHDTFTDIITFSNAPEGAAIEGDIFISIDRVKDNSTIFDVSFNKELLRVIIHGSLHLMGYNDKTSVDQKIMTSKEDFYLGAYSLD